MNGKAITGLALSVVLAGSLPSLGQAQGSGRAASGAGVSETGKAAGTAGSSAATAEAAQSATAPPAVQSTDLGQESLAAEEFADISAQFQTWLEAFRARAIAAGISEPVLDQALAGLSYDASIIERDRNQSEHTRQIWDYLDRAVSAERIANGQAALAKHRALFDQIAEKYQVEAEVIAAVWGLETAYGTYRGNLSVISSLATLAFDARRGAYFERELIEALKIIQAGHVDPAEFIGSWAGASGHTQFMPSSFWRSAVDFTGDGRRNLWGEDPADALASAAAYLAKSGWQKGLPWGVEVSLPASFPWEQSGERIRKPLSEWRALGVTAMDGSAAAPAVPAEAEASVLLPAGHEGAALLIFKNFQVIETYNTADAYVIAIGTLSDQLAGRNAITGTWPRQDKALSGAEKKALQQLLLDRGHDPRGVDGIMGPNTIQAVRDYQKSQGLVPDGYASLRLIEHLRQNAAATAALAGEAPPLAPAELPANAAEPAADASISASEAARPSADATREARPPTPSGPAASTSDAAAGSALPDPKAAGASPEGAPPDGAAPIPGSAGDAQPSAAPAAPPTGGLPEAGSSGASGVGAAPPTAGSAPLPVVPPGRAPRPPGQVSGD